MVDSDHLELGMLEPDSAAQLSDEQRAHLESCPMCRVHAKMLAEAHGTSEYELPTPMGWDAEEIRSTLHSMIRTKADGVLSVLPSSGTLDGVGIEGKGPVVRFRRNRWLGTGPRGVVFAVREQQSGRRKALKVLASLSDAELERLGERFDALKAFRHPSFVRLEGYWPRARPPFFTMEQVEGDDLVSALWGAGDWRNARPLTQPDHVRLLHTFRQLFGALDALHGAGLVHGNLKPSNALLQTDGRLVLTDGVIFRGSPLDPTPYEEPELSKGALATEASDRYSAGALLYHCLTGKPPKIGDQGDLAEAPLDTEYSELGALASRLMASDPAQRPTFDQALEDLAAPTMITFHHGPGRPTPSGTSSPRAESIPTSAVYHFGTETGTRVQIGPYIVEQELGAGGMGVVYRCSHVDTGEQVALKTVRLLRKRLMNGIRREIGALARITHPGIVNIVDQGVHAGIPWYAMQLVDGVTLRKHEDIANWREAVWSEGADLEKLIPVLTLLRGVCAALTHIHLMGMIHRDLKPGNIMVTGDRRPILVDFGLNASFGGAFGREILEVDPAMAGTTYYMSPEQIRGELVDARADLYSFGCIMYELLTGAPPFAGRSTLETLSQHLAGTPKRPAERIPGLPEQLDRLIMQLLSRDPHQRIGYAEDVDRVLAELGGEPIFGERASGVYLYRSGLVGRESELAAIERGIQHGLNKGSGKVFLIGGESGVGKTRLAMEVALREARLGVVVHTGACTRLSLDDEPAGVPFFPLRDSLQAMVDWCRDYGEAEEERLWGTRGPVLARYHPAISDLPTQKQLGEPASLPPVAARQRVLSYLAQTYIAFAEKAPLMLVIDDLLWADDLTIDFIRYLFRAGVFKRNAIFLIGTYRTEEGESPFATLESPDVTHLELGRLDGEGIAEMTREMLALGAEDEGFIKFLGRHSEGNPFFVAEYLRAAVSEGWLTRNRAGSWEIATVPETETGPQVLPLPKSIGELVRRRLSALSEESHQLAQLASVLGRQLDTDLLAAAAPAGVSVDLAIDELLSRAVLERSREGVLRFVHDKIRESTYQDLTSEESAHLHKRAGLAIEELWPDLEDEMAGQLAHHWERAGEIDKARPLYRRAAEHAAETYAHQEAQRLYRRFLRLVEAPDSERVEVLLDMARGLGLAGNRAKAIENSEAALQEALSLTDPLAQADSLHCMASFLNDIGEFDEAKRKGEAALVLYKELNARKQIGVTLSTLGWTHYLWGRPEAQSIYEEALELHREVGDLATEGRTLNRLAGIHKDRGDLRVACQLFEEGLQIVRVAKDRPYQGMITSNLAITYMEWGQFERARPMFQDALVIHREVGNRGFEGVTTTYSGLLDMKSGLLESAETLFREALAIHVESGNRRFEGVTLSYFGRTLLSLGKPAEARVELERALSIQRLLRDKTLETHSLRLLATLERRTGTNMDRAEEFIAKAEQLVGDVDNKFLEVECLCERARLAMAHGESAQPHLDRAALLIAGSDVQTGGEAKQDIEAIKETIKVFDAGGALHRGEIIEKMPQLLVDWLRRAGRLGT